MFYILSNKGLFLRQAYAALWPILSQDELFESGMLGK